MENKEFNLSEWLYSYGRKDKDFVKVEEVNKNIKEFIKRRNGQLKMIELNLTSNDPDDWETALARVRALINDEDKLAGDKLKC